MTKWQLGFVFGYVGGMIVGWAVTVVFQSLRRMDKWDRDARFVPSDCKGTGKREND